MLRNASKRVCTLTIVVSPDPLSFTPSSSSMKILGNTEKDPYDSEPAGKGHIQMEYYYDWLYSQSIRAVTKNYL
jgi:hypothetical protein